MICAPIKKNTLNSLMANLKESQKVADIVEIWLDELQNIKEEDLNKIFKIKKKPFIYKSTSNTKNIERIIKYGIEYIDLDISTPKRLIDKIKKLNTKIKIIISFHDYKKTPDDETLNSIIEKMKKNGADILKIATYSNSFEDTLRMLSLLDTLSEKKEKTILLCMGEKGKLTRTSGHLLGNYLMYAPIRKSEKTAEGQIEIKKLRQIQNSLK